MSQAELATQTTPEEGPVIRALAGEVPRPLGNLVATLVVLATVVLGVWSLIATWSGTPHNGFPLAAMVVVGTVISGIAIYARSTFSYVIAVVGAALWLWVCVVPFIPIIAVILQAVTVVIMIAGVNIALSVISYNKRRYSFSD